jgi:asparagine synthase (glutamine-hydrolysing)
MGALSFLIYDPSNLSINLDFMKSFMNMKNRGMDDTSYITESTPPINQSNRTQMSLLLSKREISEYKQISFDYGYHRMSVNDLTKDGMQPFDDPILYKVSKYPDLRIRPKRKLLCNGEIYNYNDLIESENFTDKDLQSTSDVEVIMPLYIKYTNKNKSQEIGLQECLNKLNGDFSFVLTENINTCDLKAINIFVARDIFGMKPLYIVNDINHKFYLFVSELKGIPRYMFNDNVIIKEVPPGSYWSYQNRLNKNNNGFVKYHSFDNFRNLDNCTLNKATPEILSEIYINIKDILKNAIISRYNLSHQPVGILLSGGFDSSIILSILIEYLVSIDYDFTNQSFNVFTIGGDDNADRVNAIECVEILEKKYSIDIHHHIVNVNDINLIVSEIENVIYSLETYDTSTIRQSLANAFLFKYIKDNTNVKILLSGEGLDELCGYSEFSNLSDQEFQNKSIDLISNLSKFDILTPTKKLP